MSPLNNVKKRRRKSYCNKSCNEDEVVILGSELPSTSAKTSLAPLEITINYDSYQKNTTTPALTVGGKLATPRPFTPDQQNSAQKTSIIMSMVEDNSGNQTMKCVGTYTAQKPPPPVTATSTPQVASLIINKQLMSTEETNTNKKVVTSGGYLIVGAGVNAGVNAGASRRMHTIQYYT